MKMLKSNENVFKKTIIAIILVILCNFLVPSFCYADTRTDVSDALCDFFCAVPDAGFYILQQFFLNEGDVKIHVYSKEVETDQTPWYGKWDVFDIFWNGEFDLPNIRFTPYYIFSNKIPILNANFFGDGIDLQKHYYLFPGYFQQAPGYFQIESYASEKKEDVINYIKQKTKNLEGYYSSEIGIREVLYDFTMQCLKGKITDEQMNKLYRQWVDKEVIAPTDSEDLYNDYMKVMREEYNRFEDDPNHEKGEYEVKSLIMDYLFSNYVGVENYNQLDAQYKAKNEIGSYEKYVDMIQEVDSEKLTDASVLLKPVVSKWYGILRSIAIIGLLIVLVYSSIKILISSTSSKDKAKYKQILKDWFVAMCLVFVLHFIMSFTMFTIDSLIGMLEDSSIESKEEPVPTDIECKEEEPLDIAAYNYHLHKKDDSSEATWECNSIEEIRYMAEMSRVNLYVRMGYIVMYFVLCFLTFTFARQYLKRVVYMAILTLLAPIIAFTYPIDKMTDGKAQGFNMWLREYIFNALIQFVHLLSYYIIIVSAGQLVKENPIYGIVSLGCMRLIEKLLRKFFSVGKQSSTVGPFDGAAGAALLMSGIGRIGDMGAGSYDGQGKINDAGSKPKLYANTETFDPMQILMGENVSGEEQLLNEGTESVNTEASTNTGTNNSGEQEEGDNRSTNITSMNNEEHDDARAETRGSNSGFNMSGDLYNDMLNHLNNRNIGQSPRRTIKHPRLYAAKYAAQNRLRGMPGRTVRTLGSTAGHGLLRLGGGLVGASIGLAAGVATGDASKAMKYIAAGAYATGKVTDRIGSRAAQSVQNLYGDYRQGRINIDEKYAGNARMKEFRKNVDNATYIASRYSSKAERDQVYNIAKETTKYGIDDVEDVAAIHELVKNGRSVNHAIAIAKMSKKTGDLIRKPKNRKDWYEKLVNQKQFSEQQAKTILDDIEMFQGEKD